MKFYYLRNKKRVPRGLVAMDWQSGQIGYSLCDKEDRNKFTKKEARERAISKLGTPLEDIPHSLQKIAKDMVEYRRLKTWET